MFKIQVIKIISSERLVDYVYSDFWYQSGYVIYKIVHQEETLSTEYNIQKIIQQKSDVWIDLDDPYAQYNGPSSVPWLNYGNHSHSWYYDEHSCRLYFCNKKENEKLVSSYSDVFASGR